MERLSVKFIHLLSKDARRRIMELLASTRSYRELSESLGVTPTAISKYLGGVTHPSDRVLAKAIESMNHDELYNVAKISFADLYAGFESLLSWIIDNGLLDGEMVRRLEEITARVRLASIGKSKISIS